MTDAQRIDFLAELTNLGALAALRTKPAQKDMERLDRCADTISVRYEFHRRRNDTPTAFRLAVDDAMGQP